MGPIENAYSTKRGDLTTCGKSSGSFKVTNMTDQAFRQAPSFQPAVPPSGAPVCDQVEARWKVEKEV